MLDLILPKLYPYKIIKNSIFSSENFQCEIRVAFNYEDDFKTWKNDFERNTNSSWIRYKSGSAQSSRFLSSRTYFCHHSSHRKKKGSSKDKNCSASLNFYLKKDSKYTRYRDPLLKEGYFGIIKINFMHSHKMNVAEAWNWLPTSDATKAIFLELFNTGMPPAAAKNYHESLLLSESPELLANSRINPPARWIYVFYEKWLEENLGGLNSGLNFKRILECKKSEYEEKGCIIEFQENPLSLIIITPLMQRTVNSIEEPLSVFIDSTASCDQAKSVLTFILISSKAGALPIGVAIHECQSEENFKAVFTILCKEWSTIRSFSILNFMTDNSAALKAALHAVFPGVRQLLCLFHVPQAFWRWLWNNKHKVDHADRKPIMLMFRNIMYAKTFHEFENNVKQFFGNETITKYKGLLNHVSDLLQKRDEWCLLFRLDIKNQNHNTNNYSEATVRVFKEIVLTRLKAFNAIALMQFVINVFDSYLCKRILDTVYGRLKKNHVMFQKFLDKGAKVLEKCLVEQEENFFIVESETNSQTYIVDVGMCSCPIGIQGAFCKHQAAVHHKYGIIFPNAPVLSDDEKKIYYEIAVGKELVLLNFLEPMILEANDLAKDEQSSDAPFVSNITHQALENVNDTSPVPKESLSGQNISSQFEMAMLNISTQLKNCEDQGVLSSDQNFLDKLDGIKNLSTLQKFFDGCLAASSKTAMGRKIKVQPTSVSRRKESYKGSFCCRAGRPRQDAAEKIRKRARNLIKNIKNNKPNALSHI